MGNGVKAGPGKADANPKVPTSGSVPKAAELGGAEIRQIWGTPDVLPTSSQRQPCRVGPGNFTPSPSQNRT